MLSLLRKRDRRGRRGIFLRCSVAFERLLDESGARIGADCGRAWLRLRGVENALPGLVFAWGAGRRRAVFLGNDVAFMRLEVILYEQQ